MIQKGNMTLFFDKTDPLSNWYMSDFVVKGITFNCVEQFMMFCKAKLFKDEITADKILRAKTPKEHKALGRQVAGYVESIWVDRREKIVVHGTYAKFSQNAEIKSILLSTAGTMLVEASPFDHIWGIKLAASDPRALDPSKWQGLNLLGKCLTVTRGLLEMDLILEKKEKEPTAPKRANRHDSDNLSMT